MAWWPLYQSTLSKAALASWGPGYANLLSGPSARTYYVPGGEQRIRPPALGSDEGFGGNLGAIAMPGGIVLFIAYRRRKRFVALITLGLIGSGVAVLTSQARSSLIMAVVGILAMVGLIAVGRQARRAVVGLIVAAAMAVIAVQVIGSSSSASFDRYGSIAPGSAASTLYGSRSTTWSLTPMYMGEIPFGAGLGLVGPAANRRWVWRAIGMRRVSSTTSSSKRESPACSS